RPNGHGPRNAALPNQRRVRAGRRRHHVHAYSAIGRESRTPNSQRLTPDQLPKRARIPGRVCWGVGWAKAVGSWELWVYGNVLFRTGSHGLNSCARVDTTELRKG